MQVGKFIRGLCVNTSLAFVILTNPVAAEKQARLCVTTTTYNPVVLLLHKPSHTLHVIKSGRRVNKIKLKENKRIDQYPAGVYTVLQESGNPKYARFSFTDPDAISKTTRWRGRALVAEADVATLQKLTGIPVPAIHVKMLLRLTKPGAVLVVADSHSTLGQFEEIDLFADEELSDARQVTCVRQSPNWRSQVVKAPDIPASILISERDARVYLYSGGRVEDSFRARIRYPHVDTGRHVYVAIKPQSNSEERRWMAISLAGGGFIQAPPVKRAQHVLDRFMFDDEAQSAIDTYFDRSVVLVVAERGAVGRGRDRDLITLFSSQ